MLEGSVSAGTGTPSVPSRNTVVYMCTGRDASNQARCCPVLSTRMSQRDGAAAGKWRLVSRTLSRNNAHPEVQMCEKAISLVWESTAHIPITPMPRGPIPAPAVIASLASRIAPTQEVTYHMRQRSVSRWLYRARCAERTPVVRTLSTTSASN